MCLASLCLLVVPQTWTVDDDGPADFSSLVAAIAAVSPGDTLLVMPGSYQPALLDKDLRILGPGQAPRPSISGEFTVKDVTEFTLAGLEFDNLRVENVSGRGRVDDCLVDGHSFDWGLDGTFVVKDCAELEITRTTAFGRDDFSADNPGTVGLVIQASSVELVDCLVAGGHGHATVLDEGYGWTALSSGGSEVWIAGSDLSGGDGDWSLQGGCGVPGYGIEASSSSVNIRGSSFNLVEGGSNGCSLTAASMVGEGITWSGVSKLGFSFGTQLAHAEPYLVIGGTSEPGGMRRLKLFGPAGLPATLVHSFVPTLFSVPSIGGGSIWLDPGSAFLFTSLVTAGQDVAATQNYLLPGDPALAGISVLLQAAVLSDGAALYLTNSSNLVLRF